MATQGSDCRFYYKSTCDKGSRCPLRHSEPARFSTTTCKFWKSERCIKTNCRYRHSVITKGQKSFCFYENQTGGCTRQNCSYIHERPRNRLQYHEDMSDTHAMGPCLDSRSNSRSSSCSAPPSAPTMVNTSNSIKIAWEEPEGEWEDTCIESYKIGYREYNKKHSKWAFVDTKNTQTLFTVDGLQGETEYEFKVCAVDDEGNDGPFSFPPTVMSTRPSLGKATNKFAKTKKCFFGTCSMENDEGNAKMEVIDATKKLNLVEENEPVQLDAVERQTEEVINESISSNYATDNGLKSLGNSTKEKVIQETLIYDTVNSSMQKDEDNAMMEVLDATKKLNLVENEPVQSMAVEREQEEVIKKTPTTDEIDLIEREQEEVINETPTTDEIDLKETEQEEVINKTPIIDEIDLVEREQEEAINKTPTTVEIVLIEREQEDAINKNVSSNSTTDNGLNSLGNCIEEKRLIQEKLTEDTGTCSMENDEGNAKMEVLDATKKLNLVEGNEPVQSMAVEREQEDVINENSTTDHGLNSLDNSAMQKEIQETLKNSAVW